MKSGRRVETTALKECRDTYLSKIRGNGGLMGKRPRVGGKNGIVGGECLKLTLGA